jgi:hypothetical protein
MKMVQQWNSAVVIIKKSDEKKFTDMVLAEIGVKGLNDMYSKEIGDCKVILLQGKTSKIDVIDVAKKLDSILIDSAGYI